MGRSRKGPKPRRRGAGGQLRRCYLCFRTHHHGKTVRLIRPDGVGIPAWMCSGCVRILFEVQVEEI